MKVLQLTKKVPFPLKDGESIAVTQLAKGLSSLGCKIDLLSFNSIKHYISYSEAKQGMRHYNSYTEVALDNRVKIIPAFLNLFSNKSYNISRFNTKKYEDQLERLLKENIYDVILIESLFMTVYIPIIKKYSKAKIIMRSHNIEYKIWERLSSNESNIIKKWYLSLLADRLKAYEIRMIPSYDHILSISSVDQEWFERVEQGVQITTIPTGVDPERYKFSKMNISGDINFFFIGSLDWKPNIEGLTWFIEKVWKGNFLGAHFYVAGRNCPPHLKLLDVEGLHIIGEVDDAHQFIKEHDVMIVPLFSGSGIRIKIIESMAIGRPVITTTLGIEGIDAINEKEVYIADTVEEFNDYIMDIRNNKKQLNKVAVDANTYIWNNFNQDILSKKVFTIFISN